MCQQLGMAAIAMVPFLGFSQSETRVVKFPAGKSGTVIKSSIKGDQSIDYKVGVSSGQTITVKLTSTNSANYFNLMEPGEEYVAVYNSSNDGNTCTYRLEKSGDYTIRVYLMRNAARRNETGKFSLSIGVTGAMEHNTADAKVPGTKYHATGKTACAMGDESMGSKMADFGVVRQGDAMATIDVTAPGGLKRTLKFDHGKWTSPGANSIKSTKTDDNWIVTLNDYEHYKIPEAIIFGG